MKRLAYSGFAKQTRVSTDGYRKLKKTEWCYDTECVKQLCGIPKQQKMETTHIFCWDPHTAKMETTAGGKRCVAKRLYQERAFALPDRLQYFRHPTSLVPTGPLEELPGQPLSNPCGDGFCTQLVA